MLSELKTKLIDNPQHIKNILEEYGFCNIDVRSKEIRCGIEEDTNKNSIRIKLINNDNLYVTDFGRALNCDFFRFIIQSKHVDFKDVVNTTKKELGIEHLSIYTKKKSIFGGFYDKIKRKKTSTVELNYYNEDILIAYAYKFNMKFIMDGISIDTQRKFKIGFDILSQRITCPWWSFDCRLVGVTGRYNGNYEEDNTLKWFPVIPHPKSQTLYGYTENYQYLQGCEELYIGESEKFALQLDTMEIYTGLALGGNSISTTQIKHILLLQPKKIYLALDEGLDIKVTINNLNKIKSCLTMINKVELYYWDYKESKYIEQGSKNSITDKGKSIFKKIRKEEFKRFE